MFNYKQFGGSKVVSLSLLNRIIRNEVTLRSAFCLGGLTLFRFIKPYLQFCILLACPEREGGPRKRWKGPHFAFFCSPPQSLRTAPPKGGAENQKNFSASRLGGLTLIPVSDLSRDCALRIVHCALFLFLACPAVGAYFVGGKTDCLYDSVD